MTDDLIKKQIADKLDLQALDDLRLIMDTPSGRRFFCWQIMQYGQNTTSFTRDSMTYFNEGMRNSALILEGCMKALGLSGVDLMHKAEREYIVYQEELKQQILSKQGKNVK